MIPITPSMIDDALRFMGVPKHGQSDELRRSVHDGFLKIQKIASPRSIWSRCSMELKHNASMTRLADYFDIESRDLLRLFSNSNSCLVMAVSLGSEVDRQISLAQRLNMLNGTILDACASVLADAYCDAVESEAAESLKEGEFMTMRFSPGYGDVPVKASEDIIDMLNATKRIGLSMTGSYMMTPVKSVTALIGITNKKEDRGRSCSRCSSGPVCPYRKRGETCGL